MLNSEEKKKFVMQHSLSTAFKHAVRKGGRIVSILGDTELCRGGCAGQERRTGSRPRSPEAKGNRLERERARKLSRSRAQRKPEPRGKGEGGERSEGERGRTIEEDMVNDERDPRRRKAEERNRGILN